MTTAANENVGIAASRKSAPAAESNDRVNTSSRSMNFVTWFEPAIPIAMPTPNATTTTPHPAAFAWSVVFTKIGPSASTAPTAANAITIPAVIADAIESSRRKRSPSMTSRQMRERSNRSRPRPAGAFRGTPLTITAENANVHASNKSASVCGRLRPIALLITASTANTAPPSGSVA